MPMLNPKFTAGRYVAQIEGQLLPRRKSGGLVRQRLGRSLSVMSLQCPLLFEVKELEATKHRITSALSHVC